MVDSELQPSKLGTKEYWDHEYEQELINFDENGDEGEVWFGEESIEKIVDWAARHIPPIDQPYTVEIGCGNGALLFALQEHGYLPDYLSGIDYSPCAVKLAKSIAAVRGPLITFNSSDILHDQPPTLPGQDILLKDVWDLVLDKGTFDAIALGPKDEHGKSPASKYPRRVSQLLRPGGYFLITSCNFTESELQNIFENEENSLVYHSRIQHRTYEFGGKAGSICSSVAFKKK